MESHSLHESVGKLIERGVGVVAAAGFALLLTGCGGGGVPVGATPAVVHVVWENSPSIGQVRLTLSNNFGYREQVTVLRPDGNVDVPLSLPSAGSDLLIEGLDSSGTPNTEITVGTVATETTIRVGGTATQAAIFRHSWEAPVNNTTVNLSTHVGGNFQPVPTDAQGAIILRPIDDFSYSFTNGSVVQYQFPYEIDGIAGGSTQATLKCQSQPLGSFNIFVSQ